MFHALTYFILGLVKYNPTFICALSSARDLIQEACYNQILTVDAPVMLTISLNMSIHCYLAVEEQVIPSSTRATPQPHLINFSQIVCKVCAKERTYAVKQQDIGRQFDRPASE